LTDQTIEIHLTDQTFAVLLFYGDVMYDIKINLAKYLGQGLQHYLPILEIYLTSSAFAVLRLGGKLCTWEVAYVSDSSPFINEQ